MLSKRSLVCVASSDGERIVRKNKIVDARRSFEKRRLVSVKENFNKLVMIATADVKELSDFLKELDDAHKRELMQKPSASTESRDDSGDSSENVFLQQ